MSPLLLLLGTLCRWCEGSVSTAAASCCWSDACPAFEQLGLGLRPLWSAGKLRNGAAAAGRHVQLAIRQQIAKTAIGTAFAHDGVAAVPGAAWRDSCAWMWQGVALLGQAASTALAAPAGATTGQRRGAQIQQNGVACMTALGDSMNCRRQAAGRQPSLRQRRGASSLQEAKARPLVKPSLLQQLPTHHSAAALLYFMPDLPAAC